MLPIIHSRCSELECLEENSSAVSLGNRVGPTKSRADLNIPVKISLWRAFKRREAFAVAK